MAAQRSYLPEDRARAYVVWIANGQMMKRTARDAGIPEGTLRKWIQDWGANGPPVEVAEIERLAGEFAEEAERIRDIALAQLEAKLPGANVSQLVAVVGMLTDKVNLTRGLATARTEHVQSLPPAEEIATALGSALKAALEAAQTRDYEIIDAEVVHELPPAK